MGYRVSTWEVDFHIPADKIAAALADISALQRPCWNRNHATGTAHNCQRLKPFDSLTEAVEELTGFHDCEESDVDGFNLGQHLDKWMGTTDDVLHALGRHATEGSYVRLVGEDYGLFGYRVVDGRTHIEDATVTWTVSPTAMKAE
jgi:hypothetical protein